MHRLHEPRRKLLRVGRQREARRSAAAQRGAAQRGGEQLCARREVAAACARRRRAVRAARTLNIHLSPCVSVSATSVPAFGAAKISTSKLTP